MQLLLIYDGDCPLCRNYVAVQQLKHHDFQLQLLNARQLPFQAPELLAELHQGQLVLNQTMVLKIDDRWLSGAEVIHWLAMMNEANWRNRLWLAWFRSEQRARSSYPLLRALRQILLKLLRIPPLPY